MRKIVEMTLSRLAREKQDANLAVEVLLCFVLMCLDHR